MGFIYLDTRETDSYSSERHGLSQTRVTYFLHLSANSVIFMMSKKG